MPLLHLAARKSQTALAAAEVEEKRVQTALRTKSQPGNRMTVTTEHVCLCQSFWKGKKSSGFPAVFSVLSTEGAEHYTGVFVPRLDPQAPPWKSTSLSSELPVGIVLQPSLAVGFSLYPLAHHVVTSSSLTRSRPNSSLPYGVLSSPLRFWKPHFKSSQFFLASASFPSVNHHQLPVLPVPSAQVSPLTPAGSQQFVTPCRLFWRAHCKTPDIVVLLTPSRNNRWGYTFFFWSLTGARIYLVNYVKKWESQHV